MKFDKFEDIIAWQKAKELTKNVYLISREIKDFGFNSQIQRAAISIMNNIAEGFERVSNTEFRRFLFIAKGSSAEVRSMLQIGLEINYFSKQEFDELYKQAEEISKIISGLIKTLNKIG